MVGRYVLLTCTDVEVTSTPEGADPPSAMLLIRDVTVVRSPSKDTEALKDNEKNNHEKHELGKRDCVEGDSIYR